MPLPEIDLSKFEFELPDEHIAKYPLENRADSKLLEFNKGNINHHQFHEISNLITENTLLVFNNTKVISARLFFRRASGSLIEVLIDKPLEPSFEPLISLNETESCSWECIIGNKKKWKDEEILNCDISIDGSQVILNARLKDRSKNIVEFKWSGNIPFSKILENTGHIPLPPYLNRNDDPSDKVNYQTVYAKKNGAVAAPTAGLHFTDKILNTLMEKGIKMDELTLHVGSGTFQPIKSNSVNDHSMHSERIIITKSNVLNIIDHNGPIIPIGTTSVRSLESVYQFGKILENENPEYFSVDKDAAFKYSDIPRIKAFENVLKWMERNNLESFSGETSIFIVPGYRFNCCDGLITNFHQPGTTLILLIAALIGKKWKDVYNSALDNNYRFLSYGDSSLLIP